MQISRDFGAYIKELILYSLNSKMFKTLITATGQRMTTLNRDCHHSVTLDRSRKLREEVGIGRGLPSGLSLDDREPVNSRWFPNSLHPSGRDRQSRGVTIDQYRDPCAQGSHLETFRVSLPAYCPKIHSLPGGISKYLENQNREHGGCFTV